MSSALLRVPRRAPIVLLLCLAALAAGVSSCGRSMTTAPERAGATPDRARPAGGSTAEGLAEYLDEVAVMPVEGANIYRLAADYGATVAPNSNYVCVRLIPAAGETPEHLAERLMEDSRVVVAERNAVIETAESRQESYASDDGFGSLQSTLGQPASESLELDLAHRTSDGHGVLVAVLDTGVDPGHRWLHPRIAGGTDLVDYDGNFTDRPNGIDTDGDGRSDEAYGHGTHVAGLVALTAPRARLLIVRVLDADGRGDIASVTAGLRWAIDQGADVLNLSLGMFYPSRCIEAMLEIAEAEGRIVVASAGNSAREFPREYPASSAHAIAVGASDAFSHPAPFTSFGTHVAIVAPGVNVRSSYPGNEWRLWSGTSMSAPFVSGTVALLRSRHPDWNRAQVLARLSETAISLVDPDPAVAGKLGAGMLDAGAALAADGPGRRRGASR